MQPVEPWEDVELAESFKDVLEDKSQVVVDDHVAVAEVESELPKSERIEDDGKDPSRSGPSPRQLYR